MDIPYLILQSLQIMTIVCVKLKGMMNSIPGGQDNVVFSCSHVRDRYLVISHS